MNLNFRIETYGKLWENVILWESVCNVLSDELL